MVKYLSANEIKVRHQYLPGRNTANKKYPIVIKSERPLMHVYEDEDGNYLLFKGIDVYHTLKVSNNSYKVPCQIHCTTLNLYDWTIKLLQTSYNENVYWKVKYELIKVLINEDNKSSVQISRDSGVDIEEIEKHIVDSKVPDHIQNLAIKNNKEKLINEIYKEKCLTEVCKSLLYEAVFYEETLLTDTKFKLFKKYIKSGFKFNPLASNALKKLNQIVDKDTALKFYWSSLNSDPPPYFYRSFYLTILDINRNKENKHVKIQTF
ncbi:hypothetical protein [Anaerobacillus arseniciselenatis]|nr:hypothetical protein [Anaerobacillus arseniciselenatis]